MDRRHFIKSGAKIVGAGLILPAWPGLGPVFGSRFNPVFTPVFGADAADAAPDLVLAKGSPKEAVFRALEALGGIRRFVKPDQVVVIKPNASFETPPNLGATTHPEVLTAVIEACFQAEARRVLVVDHSLRDPERCFKRTGTAEAVDAFPKAKLVSLDKESGYVAIDVPGGRALKKTSIPVVLQKADVFINLPSAKAHSATGVSLGLKNLMGLVWDRQTFHNDMDLHQAIADLATVLKPQLTILDAIRILQTGGPSGPGTVDEFNGVVAGIDPVAVDAFGVGLSTWNGQTFLPDQVAYIRHAAEHGVGTSALETLRIEELG
ncbi:MAG: DUF362 domain-containing protein [Candidatus Eisenbacteria bacterium]|uniref:DUF362 domain-containing protein n=1 Tax=Eiseniibacteriota bacterium TaxID=2212470 RepID=A0A948W7U8_UNCEI|nr:DUF362 domain-containing protein [Candidatus Eisenbacteria bacterium]MBU1948646.1 DUF362 domain-containing protein [Candidatus Eisenbacteria bacterium]MBU2692021.1 DUF362 domain-containing protein [Candidatus Eisenbacteria bacterium]